jgi:acetyl-CoA carboxylase carboxyl transferase subunit alpha
LTAPDLVELRIIDEIVREPVGGAHTNPELAAELLDPVLDRALRDSSALDTATRLERRYQKFRRMGDVGIAES